MKHVLKYHKVDILGYLNTIGFTLLFYGAIMMIAFFKNYLTRDILNSLISTLIMVAGTYRSVKFMLPYEGKYHPTFYLKPYYLFKHLLFSLKKIYFLQIRIVTIGILFLLLFFPEQKIWVVISLLAVLIYWLSLPLATIFRLLSKILYLLIFYGMYTNQMIMVIILLCFNVVVILLNFFINFRYPFQILQISNDRKEKDITLLKLVTNMVVDHLAFIVLFIIFCSMITYLVQKLLLTFNFSGFHIPIFFLTISTYITLLEVMVGKDTKELDMDRNLVILSFLNKDMSIYKTYCSSQNLLFAHVCAFIHIGGIVGLLPFALKGYFILFLSNLIMIPVIYFVSFCYFVKSIRIINRELSIFKWTFLILYFILTLIAMVGNRL
ncbi:hypothetical protein [Streptococcus sp.]|jgi:hypothetical protein|uniref:hypothetical protein n=1 Tax=Streptococcus sp. TaxID=1306 RepID=UPI0017DA5B30|nr:hypothetical protein [Streptococcus sp.]HHU65143.1 hypothetical protein [Streptococcus sp.]